MGVYINGIVWGRTKCPLIVSCPLAIHWMAVSNLTICSIFFLHLTSICWRYSGLMSIAAKPNADPFSPALWHSITVDVSIGTTSVGVHHTVDK